MKNILALGLLVFAVLIVIAIETIMAMWKRLLIVAFAFAILFLSIHLVHARDLGQWNDTDPAIRWWYQHLMQPDNPAVSCCGESDAYWADSFEVDGDKYVAIITDTRPDEPRKHIDVGTRITIPNHKLKYDQSNPTGHGIVFLSLGDYVYCYVAPGRGVSIFKL